MKIILASASPRRRELLEKLKIPFEVKVSGCSEDMDTDDPADDQGDQVADPSSQETFAGCCRQ